MATLSMVDKDDDEGGETLYRGIEYYFILSLDEPDVVAPITTNVVPTPGTPISAMQPVSVDVTDDSGAFRRVLICVTLAGITEVAHDGTSWLGNYALSGERTPIAGGFRYLVLRDGGWPSSPTLRVFAFDESGNEA